MSGCFLCTDPKRIEMCSACARSWDRARLGDDGTVLGAMRWAANRARRFEGKRVRAALIHRLRRY